MKTDDNFPKGKMHKNMFCAQSFGGIKALKLTTPSREMDNSGNNKF